MTQDNRKPNGDTQSIPSSVSPDADPVTYPRKEIRGATCSICGEYDEIDDDRTGPRHGRFFCSECADRDVRYIAECLNCEWTYARTGGAYQWYQARLRVQQEGNTHETEMSTFHGEKHETVWRKVALDDSRSQN